MELRRAGDRIDTVRRGRQHPIVPLPIHPAPNGWPPSAPGFDPRSSDLCAAIRTENHVVSRIDGDGKVCKAVAILPSVAEGRMKGYGRRWTVDVI